MLTREYWDRVFAEEDPWGYSQSQYEDWKFGLTLSVMGDLRPKRALEIACAEGHLTARLAPRVGSLKAVDISPIAVERARRRCRDLANVEFETLDMIAAPLPGGMEFILCSEVLFYLPLQTLERVAAKIVESLKPGGRLLLAHGNLITDDKTVTGFDWGHPFGAKTIGKVFEAFGSLYLEREVRTPLFTIQMFRREPKRGAPRPPAEISEEGLPFDLELSPDLERTILWDGAVVTRAEALETQLANRMPILMYHSVADEGPPELAPYRVTPRAFREQMRYLRRHGYHSVTVADWATAIRTRTPIPGRPIIITFDDGYQDFHDNAWPELRRVDFRATVFVVTDKVGGVADWDRRPGDPLKLMSWETLGKLRDAEIEIASHSASHADLSKIPLEQVRLEGETARRALWSHLEVDARSIAFPWGRWSRPAVETLRKSGYEVGLTTWGGLSGFDDDLMALSRIEILSGDDLATFSRRLLGEGPESDAAKGGAPRVEAEPQRPKVAQSGERAAALAVNMPLNPGYAKALGQRLDALIGEFVKFQTQLLRELDAPMSLQKRLTAMFCQPVTGALRRKVAFGETISPGVRLCYDSNGEVELTVDSKVDHVSSPQTHLNTLKFSFTGTSGWSWLEIDMEWGELANAERFQLSLIGRPNRQLVLQAGLRLPRKRMEARDEVFSTFELGPNDRNAVASGELTIPDLIEFDSEAKPQLLLFLDTELDLSITMQYLNVYFA